MSPWVPGFGAMLLLRAAVAQPGDMGLVQDDECAAGVGQNHCALNALQVRSYARSGLQVSESHQMALGAGCHTMKVGEKGHCMQAIGWAKTMGYPMHPDWYPTITNPTEATLRDWQIAAYNTTNSKCPRPCDFVLGIPGWCNNQEPPALWTPAPVTVPVLVKVLSYNLYWWNLFKLHGGGEATALLKKSNEPQPFDVMGFQECEDGAKVLTQAGLIDQYAFYTSGHATCMCYRKAAWSLITKGESDVAEDMRTEWYGRRSVQWMRLQSLSSNARLFFMNHHGPLSVNSGGACGGQSTANNIMQVMARNAQVGDVLVLVGDFNANAASRTIQTLWGKLTHIYNSKSFGGVDNIFSNVPRSNIAETLDLGQGGSDHHAIAVVLRLGNTGLQSRSASSEPNLAMESLKLASGADGCLIEPETQYIFPSSGWSKPLTNEDITDARNCCKVCQGNPRCTMWTFTEWDDTHGDSLCTIGGGSPSITMAKDGWASGLPKVTALANTQALRRL